MSLETTTLKLGEAEVEFCSTAEAEVLLAFPETLREWLAPGESAALAALKTPKRRREWLAARLAAKRLVRGRLEAEGRRGVCTADVRILSADTREPYVALGCGDEPTPGWPISLSHAGDYGACALAPAGCRVGMDLERIEPRDPSWRELMAEASELSPEVKDSSERLTTLWTAKEAVLKLLGIGLTVDLREIRPAQDGTVALAGKALERWSALGRPSIRLWSTRYQDCSLTVALTNPRRDR